MYKRYAIAFLPLLLAALADAAPPLHIMTENLPPSSMLDADGVTVTGRETDKIREALARAKLPYTLEILPWKRAYTVAQSRPDACLYSTSRTPEREKLFKWAGPTDEAEWLFYGRADHSFPLRTLEDARQLRIGTYVGDARDEYLKARGFTTEPVSNELLNPQKLLMKRIDLWAVGTRNGSPGPAQAINSDLIVPLLVFNRVKVYLACNPGVPDAVVARLDAALAGMRRDGTMARLERKYQGWSAPSK